MTPIFCTYFERIEKFRYNSETYTEWVAFCVNKGSFAYRINSEKDEIASEGQIIFCPPSSSLTRKIINPAEICMIKFNICDEKSTFAPKVQITNLSRFFDDLKHLKNCLFCKVLENEPIFYHYCMDVLYLALESVREESWIDGVKRYLDKNYATNVSVSDLAQREGYTVPHFINKFKSLSGTTPKAYLCSVRLRHAKELLLNTSMQSRRIAQATGFDDELYFIRFFKKHTGMTPNQFRNHTL